MVINEKGQTSIEIILLVAVITFVALVGTRLIRNIFYPGLEEVQKTVKEYALCGDQKCQNDKNVAANLIKRRY
ncbi:MAG TPA: hypothetical protein VJL87_02380 [Bdellovibrionota bacterium]|nr:hypothetical protein [Bdellovibrionota bacterium]